MHDDALVIICAGLVWAFLLFTALGNVLLQVWLGVLSNFGV